MKTEMAVMVSFVLCRCPDAGSQAEFACAAAAPAPEAAPGLCVWAARVRGRGWGALPHTGVSGETRSAGSQGPVC